MSSIERKSQQAELAELNAEYARKKKKLVQDNEEQINDLKEYYGEKKDAVSAQNEAAINHIQKRQKEMNLKATEERDRLNSSYKNKAQAMQKTYDDKLAATREGREAQIRRAQSSTHEKVREIENDAQARIEDVRLQSSVELEKAKGKFNKEMKQINEYSEKRLDQQRQMNDLSLKGEIERGREVHDEVRARNEKEHTELRQRGEVMITEEKQKQSTQLQRIDETAAQRQEKIEKNWASREERANKLYSQKIAENKKANEDQLRTQSNRFQSLYAKNEYAQRESLDIQNQRYLRQLAETRKDFVRASEKYADKENDPFYKVEDRGSRISESPNFYVLKAFVPEHEKDAVKVTIQNDKATVSGQRSFKDKIEEDGKITSSANYQTFREEFPFDKPVITEGMTRERQGDWVIYQIPKGNLTRFDRKA
ncbi:hypothetical protein ACES2L_05000 [Bdellovibrio bacteriovorus]